MGKKNLWTAEQDAYIAAHWQDQTDEEIAAAVGHPLTSTAARRNKLGFKTRNTCRGKDWTDAEIDYIREVWGSKTIPQIARKLGRSVNAVKIKAARIGYSGQKWTGEMMSARKVSELLGVDVHAVCDLWIPKHGLKGVRKRLGESKQTTTIIMFEDLLKWLEAHQDLWDSRRVEQYALGMEYDWLVAKRNIDKEKPVRRAFKWTPEEDARLIYLFKRGTMTYAEIAQELGRPASGIEHRLHRLDVWGTGKYIGDHAIEERKERKEQFTRTALLIRLRNALIAKRNAMEFGAYWQKDLCMNWDAVRGCTAGCTECDSCTDFARIKPQYCARCGGTFYERRENRFCDACRTARKKQAQRRWCRMNNPAGR